MANKKTKTDMIKEIIFNCDSYISSEVERDSLKTLLKNWQLKYFYYDYNLKEIDSWTSTKLGKKRVKIVAQIMEEIRDELIIS